MKFSADWTEYRLPASEVEINFTVTLDEETNETANATLKGDMTGNVYPGQSRNIQGIFNGTMTVMWDDSTDADYVDGTFNAWKLR